MKIASLAVIAAAFATSALLLVPSPVSASEAEQADAAENGSSIRGSAGRRTQQDQQDQQQQQQEQERELQDAVAGIDFGGASGLFSSSIGIASDAAAKKLIKAKNKDDVIPGQYIVTFNTRDLSKKGYLPASASFSASGGGEGKTTAYAALQGVSLRTLDFLADQLVTWATQTEGGKGKRFGNALKIIGGFAAQLTEQQALALASLDSVSSIEEDGIVTASGTVNGGDVPWGLDRIDQLEGGLDELDGTYDIDEDFKEGAGVRAYIIDTGIRASHSEFFDDESGESRVVGQRNFITAENGEDCNGHGTHVAGTVGGKIYGVAKKVKLIGVKVLGCSGSGSTSGVIAGVNWAVSDCADNNARCVINMSLGGGASDTTDEAVDNADAAGIVVVVAAGNSNRDAAGYSPARADGVVTVGSTTNSDTRSSFSNFGDSVDIFAPGSSIKSAWIGSDNDANTISGTSMASPHVCGVAALLMAADEDRTSNDVKSLLKSTAIEGALEGDIGNGSPNLLLYVGNPDATVAPTPSPPPTFPPTACSERVVRVEIQTDNYPRETGFKLEKMKSGGAEMVMSVEETTYTTPSTMEEETGCIDDGEYEFTITDSYGDGLCCGYGQGSYKVYVDGEEQIKGGEFGSSETKDFTVGSTSTTTSPSGTPSTSPTGIPTTSPTGIPTTSPSGMPTGIPTTSPSGMPSAAPSTIPSATAAGPTVTPAATPSGMPSATPSAAPSTTTAGPTVMPSATPSGMPSAFPSAGPSETTASTTGAPSASPSGTPTTTPSGMPSESPATPGTQSVLKVKIVTDDYPAETSWEMKNMSSGEIIMTGGGVSVEKSVSVGDGVYEFTINDSYGDGICCSYGEGSYNLYVDDVPVMQEDGGKFGSSETKQVRVGAVPCGEHRVKVEILTDNYPAETSWVLSESESGAVVGSRSGYPNAGTDFVDDIECVNDGSYTFTINDSYGDGICCAYGEGSYKVTVDGAEVPGANGGAFSDFESTDFSVGPTGITASPGVTTANPPDSCSLPDSPYFIITTDGCSNTDKIKPGDSFDLILRHDENIDPKALTEIMVDINGQKWVTTENFGDASSGMPYYASDEEGVATYRFTVNASNINTPAAGGGTNEKTSGKATARSKTGGSGGTAFGGSNEKTSGKATGGSRGTRVLKSRSKTGGSYSKPLGVNAASGKSTGGSKSKKASTPGTVDKTSPEIIYVTMVIEAGGSKAEGRGELTVLR